MKKKILFFSFAFSFTLFIVLTLFSTPLSIKLETSPNLKQQASYIEQEKKILSYLNHYKKQSLWNINLKKIIQDIENISSRVKVFARKKYPHQLILLLNEKNTALLLLKENHNFYPISYEGDLGVKKNLQDILNVPILRGAFFEKNKALRQRILQILQEIPEQGRPLSVQNISEILYHEKHDSFLLYLSTKPFVLEIEKPPSKIKLQNIDFVLNYLKKINRHKAFIDARLDKKIIVKKN
ncbi:MAG: hypothetical protein GDA46_03805 [Bdellovibrionales bacterium]|nr:hypothetical protein [Bdellovibrionales bacterium]